MKRLAATRLHGEYAAGRCAISQENAGAILESDFAYTPKGPRHWSETCVPLVTEGPAQLQSTAQPLARARELGYAMAGDGDIHVIVDGVRFDSVALSASRLVFVLPEGGTSIELRSRSFVAAHTALASGDWRSLGVCGARLQVDGREWALDSEFTFGPEWHPLERDTAGRQWRWSRECTQLAAGTRLVVLEIEGRGSYWNEPASKPNAAVA